MGLQEPRRQSGRWLLVNCAGVLSQGPFTGMPVATQQQMIDRNVSGLISMISESLPGTALRARQGTRGRILNVASAVNRAVTLGSRTGPKWRVRKIGGLIVRWMP